MVDMLQGATAVVTDSGGVQKETTALGIPCFTLRQNTERPITVTEGANRLVRNPEVLVSLIGTPLGRPAKVPQGWDGNAGARVVDALVARTAVLRPAR